MINDKGKLNDLEKIERKKEWIKWEKSFLL